MAVAVRLGIQVGIFNVFAAAKGAEVEVQRLATKTGADPLLISGYFLPLMVALRCLMLHSPPDENLDWNEPL